MEKWEQLSSEIVHQDRWIMLRADECRSPKGKRISPYYVLEESDWVHIVAIDYSNRVLICRQYRHASGTICDEIPCGVADDGEDPLVAAKRELLEETGYNAANWNRICTGFANPARQNNRIHCFLARGLTDTGRRSLDENEEIDFRFVELDRILELIEEGSFSQHLHVASFLMVTRYLNR